MFHCRTAQKLATSIVTSSSPLKSVIHSVCDASLVRGRWGRSRGLASLITRQLFEFSWIHRNQQGWRQRAAMALTLPPFATALSRWNAVVLSGTLARTCFLPRFPETFSMASSFRSWMDSGERNSPLAVSIRPNDQSIYQSGRFAHRSFFHKSKIRQPTS